MTTSAIPARRPATPPHKLLTLGEVRAVFELGAFVVARPLLGLLPKGDGHPVLVLPGFMASDKSTSPMRQLLNDLGYDARGWDLGRNVRVDGPRIQALVDRLLEIHRETGRKVSLIGWSLGGLLARELAKIHPEAVRQVISLGSPISDDRDHSDARHLFEMLNGKDTAPVHHGHQFTGLNTAPPVPTTSILTKGDGVVHWRGSVQHPETGHAESENIEVMASHIGLGVNPSVMIALADRLAQKEGAWKPFRSSLIHRWMFPKTRLH
jgi:pimeloyl-ACP methyl ester carboxylesterase